MLYNDELSTLGHDKETKSKGNTVGSNTPHTHSPVSSVSVWSRWWTDCGRRRPSRSPPSRWTQSASSGVGPLAAPPPSFGSTESAVNFKQSFILRLCICFVVSLSLRSAPLDIWIFRINSFPSPSGSAPSPSDPQTAVPWTLRFSQTTATAQRINGQCTAHSSFLCGL